MKKKPLIKITLLLVSTLTVMAGATIAPSLPKMAKVFEHLQNAELLSKLILTTPALAIVITAPFIGFIINKYGRLTILKPALVLYAVAGGLGFIIENIYIILVGRFFLGAAVAAIMTVAITLVGDYFQGDERRRFIGIQGAFMSLGGAVFVSLGGFLADIDWSYPFTIYFFSLVILLMVWRFLYEPAKKDESSNTSEEESTISNDKKSINLILFSAFGLMLIFYLLPVQIPFLLESIGIKEYSKAGYAIGMATLFSTLTGFYYGKIRNTLSIKQTFMVLLIILGFGYVAIGFSKSFIGLISSMAFAGLGVGLIMPNINTWLLQKTTYKNRGKYSGILSGALFLGQFLSPIIVLPFLKIIDLSTLFMATGILLLIVATGIGTIIINQKNVK